MVKNYKAPDPSHFGAPQDANTEPRKVNVIHGAPKARSDANLTPLSASLPSAAAHKYAKILVSLIDPSPLPPRTVYSEELIRNRAQSLKEDGQLMPIKLRPNLQAAGRYIIVDGWSRVLATIEYGLSETLDAEIDEFASDADAAWCGYECNEQREGHSDLDRAYFFKALLDQGFAENIAQLSVRSKIERSKLGRILTFAKLPDSVIAVIKKDPKKFGYFSAVIIFDIFQKAGEGASIKFAEDILEKDTPLRQQEKIRDQILSPNEKPKTKKTTQETRFVGAAGEGRLKVFNDGVDVKIRSLHPEKVLMLRELIEKFMIENNSNEAM